MTIAGASTHTTQHTADALAATADEVLERGDALQLIKHMRSEHGYRGHTVPKTIEDTAVMLSLHRAHHREDPT